MLRRTNRTDAARKAGGIFLAFLWMLASAVCAQGIVVFQENFEDGLGDFVIDNTYGTGYGLWHLSNLCKAGLPGHTQGAALYYGQDNSCDYNIGRANQGVVESPAIDLTRFASGPIELHFKYYLETELVNCDRWSGNVDIATVEVSADGEHYTAVAQNCWASGVVVLASRATEWLECTVDLSGYAGSMIRLRFGFDTVDMAQNYYDGFWIDDIVVYAPPCEYVIAGDANHDCVVDIADFAALVDIAAIAENWLLNCYQTPDDPACLPE